nr:cytochrome c oxidase subunit 2 [Microconidiobolus nodosus]
MLMTIRNDAAEAWQLGLQDSASPIAEGILSLHNEIMYYLLVILVLIVWILASILIRFNENSNKFTYKYLNHGTVIELVWTITPALILIAIAIPSFKLLYLMDEVIEPTITLKITGFLLGGLILYIINKRKDTYNMIVLDTSIIGEKNIILKDLKRALTLFNIPNIKANKRIGPHNQEIISVIIGSLLGNSNGNRKSKEGVRFVYKQGNKEYLYWLYEFFNKRGYCTNLLPREYIRELKKGDEIKQYSGYEFNTLHLEV